MNPYPVMLLTYDRPYHTRRTLNALAANTLADQTDLYIFSDGAKPGHEAGVEITRAFLKTVKGFKSVTIIEREKNVGIFKNTVDASLFLCENYDAFIGLEDDIYTHPLFLQYMNDGLNFYKDNPHVGALMGYTHEPSMKNALKKHKQDVVFSFAFHSFGWGSWRDKWTKVDWTMPGGAEYLKDRAARRHGRALSWGHLRAAPTAIKSDSELWDIRLSYYLCKNNLFCVWPRFSYTSNFGFDGTGMHKYDFAARIFDFPLKNAKENFKFSNEIDLSPKLHLGIEFAVSAKWVFAFIDNVGRLISAPLRVWQKRAKRVLQLR